MIETTINVCDSTEVIYGKNGIGRNKVNQPIMIEKGQRSRPM